MGVLQTSALWQRDAAASGNYTHNMPANFTAGSDVVVAVNFYGSGQVWTSEAVNSVTVGGVAATLLVRGHEAADLNHALLYLAQNVNGGRSDVVFNVGNVSSNIYFSASAVEMDDLDASPLDAPVSATNSNAGSTTPNVTGAAATAQAAERIFAIYTDTTGANGTTLTDPSGYTRMHYEPNGTVHEAGSAAYKTASAIETPAPSWTLGVSTAWAAAVYALKLAALAPTITVQPTAQKVNNGQTATFSVTATGVGSMTAQARKNGTNVGSAVSITSGVQYDYVTPAVSYADQGSLWDFVITDANGNITSSQAALTVEWNTVGTGGRMRSALGMGAIAKGPILTMRPKPASAGGVSDSVTESTTAAETSSASVVRAATQTDAATAADTPAATASTSATQTDAATAGETSSTGGQQTATQTDAATASETNSATLGATATQTDAATANATHAATSGAVATQTDAATAGDTAAAVAGTAAAQTDSVTATDNSSSSTGGASAVPTLVASVATGTSGTNGATSAAINTTGATQIRVYVSSQINTLTNGVLTDNKGNAYEIESGPTAFGSFPGYAYVFRPTTAPAVGTGHTFTINATNSFASTFVVAVGPSSGGSVSVSAHSVVTSGTKPYNTASITPSQPNALLIGFVTDDSGGANVAWSWTAPSTILSAATINDHANFWGGTVGQRSVTSAGAYSMQATNSGTGGAGAIIIAAFTEVSSGGTVTATQTDAATAAETSTSISGNGGVMSEPATAAETVAGTRIQNAAASENTGGATPSTSAANYGNDYDLDGAGTSPQTVTVTSINGKSVILCVLGDSTQQGTPTDNKGNSYASALLNQSGYAGGLWAPYDMRVYGLATPVGGSSHTFSVTKTDAVRESTIIAVATDGDVIQSTSIVARAAAGAGPNYTSGSVTTTGPALLIAFWSGDGGVATPSQNTIPQSGTGWTMPIGVFLTSTAYIQHAFAWKQVGAGTHTITWDNAANQGAILFLAAIQSSSGGLVDLSTVSLLYGASGQESVTLASVQAAVATMLATQTDAATAADAPNATAARPATQTDAATASDTVTAAGAGQNASQTDAATAAETAAVTSATTATQTDAATGSETSTAARTTPATQTDAAASAETSAAGFSTSATQTDAATGADTSTALRTAFATQTDAATGSDTSSAALAAVATQTDAATGSDTSTALRSTPATQIDAATAGATHDAFSSGGPSSVNEQATAAELAGATFTTSAATSEPATASETGSGTSVRLAATSEPATASETGAGTSVRLASTSEPAAASETESGTIQSAGSNSVDEAVSANATASSTSATTASAQEAASAADLPIGGYATSGAVSEPAAAGETSASGRERFAATVETLTLSELYAVIASLGASSTESAAASETLTVIAYVGGSVDESVTPTVFTVGSVGFEIMYEAVNASDAVDWLRALDASGKRVYAVRAEDRTYVVDGEDRTVSFSAENRGVSL